MEKRVNLRIEHVKHSKCRDDFLNRVKENAQKKRDAKEKGGEFELNDWERSGWRGVSEKSRRVDRMEQEMRQDVDEAS